MRLLFGATAYTDMAKVLNLSRKESCAILLASPTAIDSHNPRLLVREIYPASESAYRTRTTISAQISPEFIVPIVKRARENRLSVVFVHTHPFCRGVPSFSLVDDNGEHQLRDFLERRVPGIPHAAMVVGPDGCAARILGSRAEAAVLQIGQKVEHVYDPTNKTSVDNRWDRQVRAFGTLGQSALQRAQVSIVGLGGTGSIVAEQLAHLGITDFLLIDPDIVDETNLNRLAGAVRADIGSPKPEVAARLIRRINPSANTRTICEDVTILRVANCLTGSDAILSCTDSHASRAIINQIAYQYFIPMFDVGVGIAAKEGRIAHIAGRVQMAAPGLACLICAGVIDYDSVRRELQTPIERAADPYISGHHEPQPAVISINATMASLAVTMLMSALTPVPSEARLQYYNGISGTVRTATIQPDPSCLVCSRSGAFARGHEVMLPGKQLSL